MRVVEFDMIRSFVPVQRDPRSSRMTPPALTADLMVRMRMVGFDMDGSRGRLFVDDDAARLESGLDGASANGGLRHGLFLVSH
jgi:hypothetical protein